MLAPADGIDAAKQRAVIEYMYAHRAACPMWKGMRPPPELGEDWDEPSAEWAATEVTHGAHRSHSGAPQRCGANRQSARRRRRGTRSAT